MSNQAASIEGFNSTKDFQKKAQEDREKKEKLEREAASKMTQNFIKQVMD